jgi:hypothetical protein
MQPLSRVAAALALAVVSVSISHAQHLRPRDVDALPSGCQDVDPW